MKPIELLRKTCDKYQNTLKMLEISITEATAARQHLTPIVNEIKDILAELEKEENDD